MSEKEEAQPLINYLPAPRPPRQSSCRFFLALALCFVLLTSSWHAFSYFSRPRFDSRPSPFCIDREWTTRHDSRRIPAANGLAITHAHKGHSFISQEGHVRIEGTDKDYISVIVEWSATSQAVANGINITVIKDYNILIMTDETGSRGRHECVRLDVTVQVPSSTPFVALSFLYSQFHVAESLDSEIGHFAITTHAGSIESKASLVHTNTSSMSTKAGSITGQYFLGRQLLLWTDTGSIFADVVVDTSVKSPKATLSTSTQTGSTHVNLLAPLEHRNQIKSIHRTHVGSVRIKYPQEWEGVVEASTSVGSLSMSGEGLKIVESRGGLGNWYEKGVKGEDYDEKCRVNISTSVGSVVFKLE